jgi:hypothetical protein
MRVKPAGDGRESGQVRLQAMFALGPNACRNRLWRAHFESEPDLFERGIARKFADAAATVQAPGIFRRRRGKKAARFTLACVRAA